MFEIVPQSSVFLNILSEKTSDFSSKKHYEATPKNFHNLNPPIDTDLSKHLEEKLKIMEEQERAKEKQAAQFENKQLKKIKKIRTKSENRHHIIYTLNVFDMAFQGKITPSRQTIATIAGVHRNTFDNHKKLLQQDRYLDWSSGKRTYETNTYYLPDHVRNQTITRPKDFVMPWFLWKTIESVLKKLDWTSQQTVYQQLIKDVVHHISLRDKKIRTHLQKNGEQCGKDPPKTTGRNKNPIFKKLLSEFKLNFKDQAILSRYGEGFLRAAIDDLKNYISWGKEVFNTAAFLMSRCKADKIKIENMQSQENATPEQNIEWLKKLLTEQKNRLIFKPGEAIDRSTQEKKPFIHFRVHKTDPNKSKFLIEQKVYGAWIDKKISITREQFRETVLTTLEMAFKYSECSLEH